MNELEDWAVLCLKTMDDMDISSSSALILIYNLETFKESYHSESSLEELVLSKLMLKELKGNDNEQFKY